MKAAAATLARSVSQNKSLTLICSLLFICTSLFAQSRPFVSFDAPDAGHGGDQGTFGISINQSGAIAGMYIDSAGTTRGYVRLSNGQITEFDPPGSVGTFPKGLNKQGQIVGQFNRRDNHIHGFLRKPGGTITGVTPLNAVDSEPFAINDAGTTVGTYSDAAGVFHGFLLDATGSYTSFDVPGAGTRVGEGTTAIAINANGDTTGFYFDNAGQHGFVRDPLGNFSTFTVTGAFTMQPLAINASGEVAGVYAFSNTLGHSFLRDASGNITTIDMPGTIQTFASGVNDQGFVVGEILPPPPVAFAGFVRDASGSFFPLMVPGFDIATNAISINQTGRITGYYVDSSEIAHGFLK
jgi:hypothetical protein